MRQAATDHADALLAVDTSVAVAAFGEWHQWHEVAATTLEAGPALPAHALLETYSVLTGLPPPHRAAAELVHAWLDDQFPEVLAAPSPEAHRELVARLAGAGRAGGAVYDALVALTARQANRVLVTVDRRAASTYDLVGVRVRWLAEPTG